MNCHYYGLKYFEGFPENKYFPPSCDSLRVTVIPLG